MVRALTSHYVGLLLVRVFALRAFSGFSGFPPSTKTNTSKLQFDSKSEGRKFGSYFQPSLNKAGLFYLFIYYLCYHAKVMKGHFFLPYTT